MRRILLVLGTLAAMLLNGIPAEAGWGWHRGCGWGGGWSVGYRGCGWGGGWANRGCGPWYGGCGVSFGCYRPIVTCYSPNWGCGTNFCGNAYYAPLPIGYYGYYGSTYNPNSNFVAMSVSGRVVNRPATTPAAVRNLLDLSREDLLTMLRTPSGAPAAAAGPAIAAAKPAVRIANPEQRRKAEESLAVGDVLFREQKFHSALQRYKLASQLAPNMAETYWRQGHALIATANYELAGGAFRRALALDPETGRGAFTLDELYGGAAMAKASHLESLAGWALARGDASEPYFLMGVQLYYNGQQERANRFFTRASELAGPAGGYIALFAPATPRPVPPADADGVPPLAPEPAAAPIVERKAAPAVAVSAAVEI
jgi:tetratricopeptide (TPR) repeat protein